VADSCPGQSELKNATKTLLIYLDSLPRKDSVLARSGTTHGCKLRRCQLRALILTRWGQSDRSHAHCMWIGSHTPYTFAFTSSQCSTRELCGSFPLSIDTRVLCTVHARNHLPHLSSLRHPMGCFSSKPAQVDPQPPTPTTGRVTQRQSSLATQPVARASERSSQHGHANAGHGSPPVEEVSTRERPRSNSTPQKRRPMGFGEDLPPQVPSHRTGAKPTHASSSRNSSTLVIRG
jgi:hypothetical protein